MKARPTATESGALRRVVGIPGAVLMGLGSILGTGVFVSIGIAAGVAGPAVVIAVLLAAGVATCNGLSSAQLAARYPVSGGTYEYGYRELTPALGFTAGWMFLAAKSASAATAALGLSGYLLTALGIAGQGTHTAVAALCVLALTAVVAGGIGQSSRINAVMVSITLAALAAFVVAALPVVTTAGVARFTPFLEGGLSDLLHATALMFVAYTGYGRIATLGEEVRDPRRSIPRAIVAALVVSMLTYAVVVTASVGVMGADGLATATADSAAPLEVGARDLGRPFIAGFIALGAITAMIGVLLNLLLGLSRVLLAMARRGDVPRPLARVENTNGSPRRAVIAVGILATLLVLTGSVRTTWSFSAFTVLVYYALTNATALRLTSEHRLYPRWVSWLGLASCLGLAFWVDPAIWATGLLLLGVGLIWHRVARLHRPGM